MTRDLDDEDLGWDWSTVLIIAVFIGLLLLITMPLWVRHNV